MEVQDFSYRRVDRYLLSSQLGSGANSVVYQGIDTTLEDSPIFAIKCMPKRSCPERLLQQIAEIMNHRTVARCPNVMTLREVVEEDCHFFLVLPLREMDMFGAIWKERTYWRNDFLIKKAFVEILDGVHACHKMGVYHRDLKPENIMCNTNGLKIQIGDFGLSTDHNISREGGCGTAPYMGPECWDEEAIYSYPDLMDIWSLGVILFNMVTCCSPWEVARPADKDYLGFLRSADYLLHKYPISEALNSLLFWIWHPCPPGRPSIPAIREAVLALDTFYKPLRPIHATSLFPSQVVEIIDSEQTCVGSAEGCLDAKGKDYVSLVRATAEVPGRITNEGVLHGLGRGRENQDSRMYWHDREREQMSHVTAFAYMQNVLHSI